MQGPRSIATYRIRSEPEITGDTDFILKITMVITFLVSLPSRFALLLSRIKLNPATMVQESTFFFVKRLDLSSD